MAHQIFLSRFFTIGTIGYSESRIFFIGVKAVEHDICNSIHGNIWIHINRSVQGSVHIFSLVKRSFVKFSRLHGIIFIVFFFMICYKNDKSYVQILFTELINYCSNRTKFLYFFITNCKITWQKQKQMQILNLSQNSYT